MVHTFPKGIFPKVNVIARLEYELAYYDSAVHRFNHYTTRTPGRRWYENIPTNGCQRNRTILDKNIATKIHNEKAEWINNMTSELEGFEEGKKSNRKTPGHDEVHGIWFKKFIPIHDRLAIEMNRCLRSTSNKINDQRKDHIDPKGHKQRNCSKRLQTHNLPTDDVEKINSTKKGSGLQITNEPRIVPWGTERMLQRIQKHSRITLHRSTRL